MEGIGWKRWVEGEGWRVKGEGREGLRRKSKESGGAMV